MLPDARRPLLLSSEARRLNILIHDYSGHPFQVGLSRELARRGHAVHHCYDRELVTPHGDLAKHSSDPQGFSIESLSAGEALAKHALWKRWRQERAYGRELSALILQRRPDIVLSGNTPLGAQELAVKAAKEVNARFVFWLQDLYGVGIDAAVRKRIPLVGRWIGRYFVNLERQILARSDAVIVISDDFASVIKTSGIRADRVFEIENWAPIEELAMIDSSDDWKNRNGLAGRFVFLYAGTLGFKHNPEIISGLADAFVPDQDVSVVVVSEGVGAEWLRARQRDGHLANITVMAFRPYQELAEMLRAADVLLAILEPEASVFAVPSKVLTYMCSGRPLLAAIPRENLAARTIVRAQAGIVTDPRNPGEFAEAAMRLLADGELRKTLGDAGRRYAERNFRISEVADRFEVALGIRDRA